MSHQSELIATDIQAYLAQHERKELLRLLTCGSVDDGKSTLIGRLLHDSKMVYEDQLAAVRRDSVKSGTTGGEIDLALLVDGLQAEREQGITIDVAYRYFSTSQRKYIIADTPGHEQYTRNMATGASTADLAVILIDARNGILVQTRRHSFIVSLLGIKHVLVAINKMDLVGYSQAVFEQIKQEYLAFVEALDLPDVRCVPISALKGDNVVNASADMPWYDGPPLMSILDTIEIDRDRNLANLRFPVQWVNRPNLDFRGFSGTLAAGTVRRGDAVMTLPSRKTSRVKSIVTYDGELDEAFAQQAVTLTLEDEIDVSRGDVLVHPNDLPFVGQRFQAHIVWMNEAPMRIGKQYYLKAATKMLNGSVAKILARIDVNTMERSAADRLNLNEIGLCEVAVNAPLAFDRYRDSKGTGAFILIDRITNVTVGAGMITDPAADAGESGRVTAEERAIRYGQRPALVCIGGSNAVALADALERQLFDAGHAVARLDDASAAAAIRAAGLIGIVIDAGEAALGAQPDAQFDSAGTSVEDALAALREAQIID